MVVMKVKTDSLNLRRAPQLVEGNIITALVLAQEVEVIQGNPTDRFWEVKTVVDGSTLQGFASAAFLRQPVSPAKEALISAAVKEWLRFDRGNKLEYEDPHYKYVGEYWSKIGLNYDGRDRDQPWSAAFISFVTRAARYHDFKFAPAHSTYVYDAVDKRKANVTTAPFWGFEVKEHKPQLGDLVCRTRDGVHITSMASLPRGGFKSHCDIVVEVRDSEVRTLGGNVNQSVSITSYPLDNNGFLRKVNSVYGVLKNNL
ncbi:DUF2272 domain-containing protein [Microcoleus sp.]|uniref:DUF2272 domain-containing protein n=1 Tax=Microcoleus sp. TaxID=44472 RepID=UPI0035945A73